MDVLGQGILSVWGYSDSNRGWTSLVSVSSVYGDTQTQTEVGRPWSVYPQCMGILRLKQRLGLGGRPWSVYPQCMGILRLKQRWTSLVSVSSVYGVTQTQTEVGTRQTSLGTLRLKQRWTSLVSVSSVYGDTQTQTEVGTRRTSLVRVSSVYGDTQTQTEVGTRRTSLGILRHRWFTQRLGI